MHIHLTFYLTSVEPFILHCCATIKSYFHFTVWLQAQTVNSCWHCCNILMVSRCWCNATSQSQIKSCKIKNDNYRPAACMLLLSLLCNNGEGKNLWSVPTPKESRNIFGVGKLSSVQPPREADSLFLRFSWKPLSLRDPGHWALVIEWSEWCCRRCRFIATSIFPSITNCEKHPIAKVYVIRNVGGKIQYIAHP